MTRLCAFLLLMCAFCVEVAHAQQSPFRHARVQFQGDNHVDLEKARQEYGGNVFIFFYKQEGASQRAADSTFLADERISALLNEKYARYAIDLDSDYAALFFSQVTLGGPTDEPFLLLISQQHQTHQGIWSSWTYEHPLSGVDQMRWDQLYWKLWNFADHGSTMPRGG